MRKVVLLMHVSLDGFVAGPKGEMDWILFDEALADYAGSLIKNADAAIYGRNTFRMMESYWPTAGKNPSASKHDKEHSAWVNEALKIVFSKTVKSSDWKNTRFFTGITPDFTALKRAEGKNMLLIGSPTLVHAFISENLIDEYRLNINPVILGEGIPMFNIIPERIKLELTDSQMFGCGVVALTYVKSNP